MASAAFSGGFPFRRPRLAWLLLPGFGAFLLLAPLSAAASTIILPPPIDKMLDVILGYPPNLAPGNSLDGPQRPQTRKAEAKTPRNILPLFLGIPYRPDGVINDDGQYALFNTPGVPLRTPGLNCSGLVLSAARILLDRNITIAEATRDREGDSGPGAPYGHDWDFGFDLIMNISEGFSRAVLIPQGMARAEEYTGKTVPSFDIHGREFTEKLLPKLREDVLYLVSFSRHKRPDAPPRLHYHTGVIVKDRNAIWLYSTTRDSGKAIRHNLATDAGLAAFRKSFANTPNSFKRLTVLAVYL